MFLTSTWTKTTTFFLFNPLAAVSHRSQISTQKFLRLTGKLSTYRYRWCGIKENENIWTNSLSIWSILSAIVHWLVSVPEPPSSCVPDFEFLAQAKPAEIHLQYVRGCTDMFTLDDNFWTYPKATVWVPIDASHIQPCFYMIAHSEPTGSWGCGAIECALPSKYK